MPVLRASAGDHTQAVRRSTDSSVIGKARGSTNHPIVPSGRGVGFQLTSIFREIYFQTPATPARVGILENVGKKRLI